MGTMGADGNNQHMWDETDGVSRAGLRLSNPNENVLVEWR